VPAEGGSAAPPGGGLGSGLAPGLAGLASGAVRCALRLARAALAADQDGLPLLVDHHGVERLRAGGALGRGARV